MVVLQHAWKLRRNFFPDKRKHHSAPAEGPCLADRSMHEGRCWSDSPNTHHMHLLRLGFLIEYGRDSIRRGPRFHRRDHCSHMDDDGFKLGLQGSSLWCA